MLADCNLLKTLWAEALHSATYIYNRCNISQNDKTPYEVWTGQPVDTSHIHCFASNVFIHVPKELRSKLDYVSEEGYYLGPDPHTKGYHVWIPERR